MCGVGGFSRSAESAITNPKLLAKTLAVLLQDRGTDATGFAWWEEEHHERIYYTKRGERAAWFVPEAPLANDMTTCIVHTRHGTKGTAKDNFNNHPIITEGIALVHNGVLSNDDEIIKSLGSDQEPGEVDSRALAHLLAFGPEVYGVDRPEELFEDVRGGAAFAWLDYEQPDSLFLIKLRTYPLYVVETVGDDLIFASTQDHAENAAAICDIELKDASGRYINDARYLRVHRGQLVEQRDVKVPPPPPPRAPLVTKTWASSNVTHLPKDESKDDKKDESWGTSAFPHDVAIGTVWKSGVTDCTYVFTDRGWVNLSRYNAERADNADKLLSEPADPKPNTTVERDDEWSGFWIGDEWHPEECNCMLCQTLDHPDDCMCKPCSDRWWLRVNAEQWDEMLQDYQRRQAPRELTVTTGGDSE